jgi:ABC-type nitrate/sulfonate/bicarbonate transport system ATPase subunit
MHPEKFTQRSETAIEVEKIKKSFGSLYTLEDVSITLKKNQFVTVLGPSGCGKSTLFDIIAGLERPDYGSVQISGTDYTGKTGRVSYMHQKDLLFPWYSILKNVCLPLLVKGKDIKQANETALPYFKTFGLDGFENKYPAQLSGGMRQRAALLRTFLFADDIMLLDEPFGSLDSITRHSMQMWLLEILDKIKASILFITHDIDEAVFLSDRIYLLSKRPAVVKKIFDVTIPCPRDNRTFVSPEFIRIKEEIMNCLD